MSIKHLEIELPTLKHDLHQLRIENRELQAEINQLTQKNATLTLENQQLRNQIITLEDKLNINSRNSGPPTSKEIYRIEKKARASSGRNLWAAWS